MLPNRLSVACLFALLTQAVFAAPMPRLDQAAPTRCPASPKHKGNWVPTAGQVAALEQALPGYFAATKAHPSQLPLEKYVYARQYDGITRDGRRYIYGSFYPANDPTIRFMKPGSCWWTSDGGNAYWNVTFDVEAGVIVSLDVNGIA